MVLKPENQEKRQPDTKPSLAKLNSTPLWNLILQKAMFGQSRIYSFKVEFTFSTHPTNREIITFVGDALYLNVVRNELLKFLSLNKFLLAHIQGKRTSRRAKQALQLVDTDIGILRSFFYGECDFAMDRNGLNLRLLLGIYAGFFVISVRYNVHLTHLLI